MAQMQNDRSKSTTQANQTAPSQPQEPTPNRQMATNQGQGMTGYRPQYGYGYGSPFSSMRRFMEQMDHVFGEFAGGPTGLRQAYGRGGLAAGQWAPPIEVFREGDRLVVRADLPGMSKEDIHIEIQGDMVTIAGERRHEHEERREGWFHSERSYGSFERSVQLPSGVQPENAEATFDNGVLEVRFAARAMGGRKVEIRGKEQGSAPTAASVAPDANASKPPREGGSDVH